MNYNYKLINENGQREYFNVVIFINKLEDALNK